MAESDTILQLGIDAAREGNRDEARNLFSLLTRQEPDNLSAWLWLAGVANTVDERRVALERVLELDPTNEMAAKGLQSIGSSNPTPSTPPPPPPPAAPAREMTDEERYAAELDSAFDDYDLVPRAETPVRVEPELDTSATAASSSTEPRMTARQRSAARRNTPTPVHASNDDDDDDWRAAARTSSRPNGLRNILMIALGVLLLLFLLWFFFLRGGGDPESTIAPTTVPATLEATVTPEGSGGAPTNAPEATAEPEPTAEPTSEEPQPSVPPSSGELAAANPQPVEVGAELSANGWRFTFPGICVGSCATILGPQIGSSSANGSYVVVLVLVANDTGNTAPLPADFFVLKDEQGRVYNALPAVSSQYAIPGVNADISMEAAVPANGAYTSMPVIFDVEHGATNLVFFSGGNMAQGWPVLANVP